MGTIVVLVSEAQGLRVCLECHAVFERGEDEVAWMAVHLGGPEGVGCTLVPGGRPTGRPPR